jgi:hypothetical protein
VRVSRRIWDEREEEEEDEEWEEEDEEWEEEDEEDVKKKWKW